MAWMSVMGACYACNRIFSFNADLVPSIPIDGVRQPICQDCVDRANVTRKLNGLEPIVPLPGAYEPEECL
jgi:hypothetical protein